MASEYTELQDVTGELKGYQCNKCGMTFLPGKEDERDAHMRLERYVDSGPRY